MSADPDTQRKVDVGVQTVAGYAAAVGTFVAPLIAYAADIGLPVPVQVTLIIVGGALAGITGKNRSDQRVAKEPQVVVARQPAAADIDVQALAEALVAEVRAAGATPAPDADAGDELPEPDGEWHP